LERRHDGRGLADQASETERRVGGTAMSGSTASPGRRARSLLLAALVAPAILAGQETAPAKKWSVEEIHGPARKLAFTVDEGTWMSVDVSPDGRTLIFDLLGDLYMVPIGGGKATR